CIWDVRDRIGPSILSKKNHKGHVNCLQWSYKCNHEILSGSSNGEVCLWDFRKMDDSVCRIQIGLADVDEKETKSADDDLSEDSQSENAITSLEFDKLNSKLIRIGTGNGRVIFANKNEIEEEIKCHESSISSVTQNWASYKCILTIDSSDVKIWGENMKGDPIFSMSSIDKEFCCGMWSLTRYSRFFIGKKDGTIQLWDLTFDHNEPYFSL
ncbi:Dynein axonemal intermediate chain 2, partial [Pseudolycoriella hygida]